MTELPLKLPTLNQETATGRHEEAWLRNKILSGLTKDEKIAASLFGRTDNANTIAKMELEMDKMVLQMIDVSLDWTPFVILWWVVPISSKQVGLIANTFFPFSWHARTTAHKRHWI